MSLKDLPAEQRPREKLLERGPGALADTELLALLLRTGLPGHDVFRLSQQVLERFGGFAGLLQVSAGELGSIKGLGPAKRAELVAVLTERLLREDRGLYHPLRWGGQRPSSAHRDDLRPQG